MKQLFKEQPKKAQRVYRVENLNSEKGISTSMRVDASKHEYAVCLCLPHKTTRTVFHSERQALDEMVRYRKLYREIKQKKTN